MLTRPEGCGESSSRPSLILAHDLDSAPDTLLCIFICRWGRWPLYRQKRHGHLDGHTPWTGGKTNMWPLYLKPQHHKISVAGLDMSVCAAASDSRTYPHGHECMNAHHARHTHLQRGEAERERERGFAQGEAKSGHTLQNTSYTYLQIRNAIIIHISQ